MKTATITVSVDYRNEEEESLNNDFGGVKARAFLKWPDHLSLPCFKNDRRWNQGNSPTTQGFLFMKLQKCASSTMAGINIRIARYTAQQQEPPP